LVCTTGFGWEHRSRLPLFCAFLHLDAKAMKNQHLSKLALMVLVLLSLFGCHSSAGDGEKRRQIENAKVWNEEMRLFFRLIEVIETNKKTKQDYTVQDVIHAVRRQFGEDQLKCPICGQRFKINPNRKLWSSKAGFGNEVAVYCDNVAHKGALFFRFDGAIGKTGSLSDWSAVEENR
jgi:hypothetical protein